VWTWDITKLATIQRGIFLHAYVIIDLFSRYVVGWMVATKECKHLAAQLFAETVARHDVEPRNILRRAQGGDRRGHPRGGQVGAGAIEHVAAQFA